MLTSNQFRCEIERPFTNLIDISTKLAGKTYINDILVLLSTVDDGIDDIPVNFFLTAQVPLNETFGREVAT